MNEMLNAVDSFEGIFIASTNLLDDLAGGGVDRPEIGGLGRARDALQEDAVGACRPGGIPERSAAELREANRDVDADVRLAHAVEDVREEVTEIHDRIEDAVEQRLPRRATARRGRR